MMKIVPGILITLLLAWSASTWAGEIHYELQVDGLVCPFCEYNVEKKLGQIEGVKQVKVNLEAGSVYLLVAQGHSLSTDRVREAITDAGFTLKSIKAHVPEKQQ